MKTVIAVIGAIILAGCGREAPPPPVLECWAAYDQCPSQDDLDTALDIFADEYPQFDVEAEFVVEWHAYGEVFQQLPDGLVAVGETPSGKLTRLSSFWGLAHELVHVQDWREGHVDYDHSAGDGVWTVEDDLAVDRLQDTYSDVFDLR